MPFSSFKTRLESLTGRKAYGAAFGLGALLTLSLPPLGFAPMLLLCAPGLAWLAAAAPTRGKSFCLGWAFGAGYFIFGLYWISAALFVDISEWFWVLPLSFLLGPAVLGLFYGLIPLLARRWRNDGAAHALAVAAAWSGVEWLRGHVLTGFPWNLPGYAWHWVPAVQQTAAAVGIYGLTLLTLAWAMIPALPRRLALTGCATLLLAALLGTLRLELNPTAPLAHTALRIVQPDIALKMKVDNAEQWRNLDKHLALTRVPAGPPARTRRDQIIPPVFVIWPETAVDADPAQYPEIAQKIGHALPPGALGLIGTLRVVASDPRNPRFYNSLSVLDGTGKVRAVYDKHHLVPFGEYIPGRSFIKIPAIAQALSDIGDFTPGPGPRTLALGGFPAFSPLICYEAIFPHAVADPLDRPGLLVNITNDGWYGKTAGPHQHLAIARLRAIEEGLPLARAANTGISAVFDPLGRELGSLALDTSGTLDTPLPQALPPTPYAQWGDAPFFALLAALFAAAEILRRRTAEKRR